MIRLFDIIFASIAIILLAPMLLPIFIVLKLTGEGEVFYLQDRVGRGRKLFKLIKFATMKKNSPNIGTGTVTIRNDPRVLPVGKFLRKTKINELPQLLNILFGEMSVIGPRPLTTQTFGAYHEDIQQKITRVRPGLSGLGSIIFRGEEDIMFDEKSATAFYSEIIAPYKGTVEKWFIDNHGTYMYFACIFLTIWVVVVPNSSLVWKAFKSLPEPPDRLKEVLNHKRY